jgi:hypothetical protein
MSAEIARDHTPCLPAGIPHPLQPALLTAWPTLIGPRSMSVFITFPHWFLKIYPQ